MTDDTVQKNLKGMDTVDFEGFNKADWHGIFSHYHTDDVHVELKGTPTTDTLEAHIAVGEEFVKAAGGSVPQITEHPIAFGSGDWTCVVGVIAGERMVTVAKWRDGAIAEEYIWM